ncbi:hypothetical protein BJ170DRAFT_584301 [Xylariales sp. AK1849]|nr:hypothetical protein BJ170DRAFT_584301 [Xylariales sp. AK1849]
MAFRIRILIPATTWLLARLASCGSMAAWYTDVGPSLLVQDDESGAIRYSLCNSNGTPILPQDKTITAPLYSYTPKNGTSLAGTGWFDSQTTYASIFYQDENDEIINSFLKCDTSTGYWLNNGDFIISGGAPSVSSTTGLAAVLLGADAGYRVYYHDANNTLHQLGYTSTTEWDYKGGVSSDGSVLGKAIGATFSGTDNITVVTAKDIENMEVARYYPDDLWHLTTFPRPLAGNLTTNVTNATSISLDQTSTLNFTLPAWDGTPSSFGLSVDHNNTRSIFYIGTDSELFQIANIDDNWRVLSRPNETFWPQADDPKAPLAVASTPDLSQLRVYYQSGGEVMELTGDGGKWQAAATLPNYNTTKATPSPSSSGAAGTSSSAAATAAGSGLSTGAKAGIGVGVSVGALAVAGVVGAILLLRKRQQRRDAADAAARTTTTTGHTSDPAHSQVGGYSEQPQSSTYSQGGYGQVGGYDGQPAWNAYKPVEKPPGELGSEDHMLHEMPENRQTLEMMGEGHYREAP